MKKIKFIEVRSELGAGLRGSGLGVDAIKIAAINSGSRLFFKYPSVVVKDANHLLFKDSKTINARRVDGIVDVFQRIYKTVAKEIKSKTSFPVVLAADHSNAGGTIAGIKKAFRKKRLGVIWIDAHADLHSPYTSPSGNVHGMPLSIALGVDNLECKKNEILPLTRDYWEKLKLTGGFTQKVLPEDVVFIGVRDYEKEEEFLMNKFQMRNFTVAELRQIGVAEVVKQSIEKLKNCDIIYISFDVDSLDPSISRGTGTPVANGLTEKETSDILCGLLKNKKSCCLEIVEVNPLLDNKGNVMAETAFRIMDNAIRVIEKR
jgi:arginase